jgi:2-oxoglutarate ferredoxin oxidoreductase subunit alpha
VDRIAKKFETAKTLVPSPIVELVETSKVGLIAYGSTDIAMVEARNQLYEQYQRPTSYMRLRAFPFHPDVERFIDSHEEVYVIDQNREGQMRQLLCRDFPHLAPKLKGIRHYNGQPIEAAHIIEPIVRGETH